MHPASSVPRFRLKGFARQAGFTLMELMVGMTIGMIATIVIVQVMNVFEAQKRATTGSADAQTNGGIALYSIAREAAQAGFPLYPGTDTPLSCTTVTSTVAGITDLTPLAITEVAEVAGASGSPAYDKITIRYGTPAGTNSGMAAGIPATLDAGLGADSGGFKWSLKTSSNLGCKVGDVALIYSGGSCNITKILAVVAGTISPAVADTVSVENQTGAAQNASIACVGAWNEITYQLDTAKGNLDRRVVVNGVSDGTTVNGQVTGTVPTITGIVNLQAQYGVSASATSNVITGWVNASAAPWVTPSVADRNRIKAVRIAVVARNAKKEQSDVSSACSSTTAAAPTGVCAWDGSAFAAPSIDLSPGNTDWKRYRYRVFETIVPLRNVIWSKDTL